MMSKCSVPGCNGSARRSDRGSNGYCSAHYQRLKRLGDANAGGPAKTPKGEPIRFLEEVVIPYGGSDCLTWPYGTSSGGYAQIYIGGKMVQATRYVCALVHGEPPTPSHEAAHSCGKGHTGCISPVHLRWATSAENKSDKLIHGTHNRGERQGSSKLREDQVREILALKGVETQQSIANRFGVARPTVAKIHNGTNWGWLEGKDNA